MFLSNLSECVVFVESIEILVGSKTVQHNKGCEGKVGTTRETKASPSLQRREEAALL